MSDPVLTAWKRLRLELILSFVHWRTLLLERRRIAALRRQRGLKLQLGSGDVLKPGWTNVDLCPAADLRLDVRRPWPFADGSAQEVYAEHLFEHLGWPSEADHFLAEARRVLASGGRLRLSVPDLARHVRAYVETDEVFRRQFAPFLPPDASTWGDALNHHLRQFGEHQYAYDSQTLAARLARAGFEDATVVAPSGEYEQPSRNFESLVMTARRP